MCIIASTLRPRFLVLTNLHFLKLGSTVSVNSVNVDNTYLFVVKFLISADTVLGLFKVTLKSKVLFCVYIWNICTWEMYGCFNDAFFWIRYMMMNERLIVNDELLRIKKETVGDYYWNYHGICLEKLRNTTKMQKHRLFCPLRNFHSANLRLHDFIAIIKWTFLYLHSVLAVISPLLD
jgi:hypothetical protein